MTGHVASPLTATTMDSTLDASRALLRHAVATLAYRAAKALHDAPPEFVSYQASPTSRTPTQILTHMGDLFDWALSLAQGQWTWHNSTALPWDEEVARFFRTLTTFDEYLASPAPLGRSAEQLFQGPVADALTHTGQLTLLRRAAGSPVRGESYARAEIVVGRTGIIQAAPLVEFD
jgi:hypothetical protein